MARQTWIDWNWNTCTRSHGVSFDINAAEIYRDASSALAAVSALRGGLILTVFLDRMFFIDTPRRWYFRSLRLIIQWYEWDWPVSPAIYWIGHSAKTHWLLSKKIRFPLKSELNSTVLHTVEWWTRTCLNVIINHFWIDVRMKDRLLRSMGEKFENTKVITEPAEYFKSWVVKMRLSFFRTSTALVTFFQAMQS